MFPLDDTKSTHKFPFWTFLITGINLYVFFLELTVANPDGFIAQYALIPSLVDFSNLETLKPFITSQFLHGGFIHILSNLWFLWIFGDNVEAGFGFLLFPIVYLLSGIVGALTQYLLSPGSTIPMLGASGAIAGVLGAYFVLFPHHKIKTLVPVFGFFTVINLPASLMIIYWFITQLFSGAASITQTAVETGGIAYAAHVGGFVAGAILAQIAEPQVEYIPPD